MLDTTGLLAIVIVLLFIPERERIAARVPAALAGVTLWLTSSVGAAIVVFFAAPVVGSIVSGAGRALVSGFRRLTRRAQSAGAPAGTIGGAASASTKVLPKPMQCPACGKDGFQPGMNSIGEINRHWWHCTACGYQQRVRVREACPQCLAPNPSYYPYAGFHSCDGCGWDEEWEFEDAQRIARIIIRVQRRMAGNADDEDEEEDVDDLIEAVTAQEFNIRGSEKYKRHRLEKVEGGS